MKVVSLFDGISCGRVALERAGLPVSRYVAFEIDQNAINCSNWNYPDIEHRGSVIGADFCEYNGFDIVMGGFPCTDLSIGKKNRKGLKGENSRLFWELVKAIKEVNPRYFLVENNYGMPKKDEAIITETLGVKPICINSALVSAQNRKRLYWTNIPNVEQPEDKGILLKDILVNGMTDRKKSVCVTKSLYKKGESDCIIKSRCTGVFAQKVCNVNPSGKGQNGNVYYSEAKAPCITRNKGEGFKIMHGIVQRPRGFNKGGLHTDKAPTLTKSSYEQNNVVIGAALRSWPRNTKTGRYKRPELRYDEKANALTSVQTDSMTFTNGNEYGVKDGILYYRNKEIPVKLPDGFYSIRKLTPLECERLQTLPDGYTEMLSNTQRYITLGNGWTVDVIAHILNYINVDMLL